MLEQKVLKGLAGVMAGAVLGSAAPLFAGSTTVSDLENKLTKSYQTAAKVQERIDGLDDKTRQDYYEYVQTVRQVEQIEKYNKQVQALVVSQQSELEDLQQQLKSLQETEQTALPLLSDMFSTLKRFIERDLPFLMKERLERITRLEGVLSRSDVSVAEKYRQVLEAYQIEVEYGRTLEANTGVLRVSGQADREVTFLRLGRVGLYYQTSDGQQSGQWNASESGWEVLDSSLNWSIQKGIQMALQQTVPELLELPIVSERQTVLGEAR